MIVSILILQDAKIQQKGIAFILSDSFIFCISELSSPLIFNGFEDLSLAIFFSVNSLKKFSSVVVIVVNAMSVVLVHALLF